MTRSDKLSTGDLFLAEPVSFEVFLVLPRLVPESTGLAAVVPELALSAILPVTSGATAVTADESHWDNGGDVVVLLVIH